MLIPKIKQINVFPIKSTAQISLDQATVLPHGLAFDREFVITDLDGKFITGRTKAKLVLVSSTQHSNGYFVNAPGMKTLEINYDGFSNQHDDIRIWSDDFPAQHCNIEIDTWFSLFMEMPCRVYYYGKQPNRKLSNSQQHVSFADGYPLLAISTASLDALNERLDVPVSMKQFRTNLVIDNCLPFGEDSWLNIQIGAVKFLVSKPCSRCIFTTVNAESAQRDINKEPLKTLKSFRQGNDRQIYFGQNLVPLNEGIINVGDEIKILSTQQPIEVNN